MKSVLITGANGFIARNIARSLSSEGWQITGVSRTGDTMPDFHTVFRASLGDSLSNALSADSYDAVIHTANATGNNEYRLNVDGTTRWANEARSAGVPLQIFLSSVSASEQAMADYGRAKYTLEKLFIDMNEVVLSLGLVAGNGGLYARMRESLNWPVAPLLDGGNARVHILGIDFLCDVIRDCIRKDGADLRGRLWRIHQPRSYSLRELIEEIRRASKLKCLLLPVPSLPILGLLTITEKLSLKLPVSTTNIRGLRQSRHEYFESDYEKFGYPELTLEELVRQANAY